MNGSNNFFKNSLITFFTQIAVFIFSFISFIIITRVLGPEGRGIYSLILIIPGMIMTFGNLGLSSGNVYFTGSKKYKVEDIVSNSLISSVFLGLFLILIFWLISQFSFFKIFIDSNRIPIFYLWLVVLFIPVFLILNSLQSIIQGAGRIMNYNWTIISKVLIEFSSVVFFLIILRKGIAGAIISNIFATVVAALLAVMLVKKISRFYFSINKKLLKDSFIYGGKVYFANAASFLNYRLDMILIAVLLKPEIAPISVGIYSIAVAISEKLFMVPGALATVLFPKVSSLKSSEADDFTPRIVRHTFFIMIVASLLMVILASPFINIVFGPAFVPAINPLFILLPGIIAFGVGGVIAADLSGRGKPQYAVYSSFTCLVINVILNIIFIPKWGIAGAAFASAVAYWADTIVIIVAFLKISKKSLSDILLIRKEDLKDYVLMFKNLKVWATAKMLK